MYSAYDPPSSRSPGSHRHQPQTLHRQPSRQFDAYGQLPTGGLYTAEDHARGYEQPRNYDRLNATIHGGYGYDMGTPAWNATSFAQNTVLSSLGGAGRIKQSGRGRSALPSGWLDQPQGLPSFALPGLGSGHPSSMLSHGSLRQDNFAQDVDEELIPTAIVIKNIPFAVKKEQLVQLMTDLRLPLPYAFNYHFDNGVFRGLAFANFTTAEETAQVIDTMNHFELHGRKLRVEYKKMLPLAERERIEREKRERRGQLEEQHRPLGGNLQTQASFASLASHIPASSPSPVNGRPSKLDVDLNDPQVLQFYSQLLLFKETAERESMTFPPTLAPSQRRIVHTLSHQMGLAHVSKGSGEQRAVHIFKVHDGANVSPPMPQMPTSHATEQPRRGLNRAATTDFSDVRASDGFYNTFGRHTGLLGFPDSPGGLSAAPNLRAAKSYADLRSYTPSPVPSTASYPIGRPGGPNMNDLAFGSTSTSTNPNSTPTAASMAQRDDSLLENALGRMQIGSTYGQGGSPRALRNMTSWENPGPIGGHRTFSTNYDDQSRDRGQGMPSRQPRGPIPERSGFGSSRPRQNGHHGRGSDELPNSVEIVVEH
ncbi:uncharacterized protein BDR25DRAFT_119995 [Lindgomyces ingoldianus]|uniref:Uncharacterized protein n=1 Tax=Lindgomyces ingoldianus TaxID=673940 RepID=A0ACB6R4L5_9PLEO|nr:uncharacterized protein BDR25DRAFT_119995 [Lindgomyces ingoldianus]KAF2474208.1 hypothetical protein BDR25DRAFT_119995 [Lindgomyces ingoldianus]